MEKYLSLLGRLLISIVFILSGFLKIAHWRDMLGLFASLKIPLVPIALAVTVLIEIGVGLCIAAGYQARLAAVVQFLYLIPVTCMLHNFWAFQGLQRQDQMAHFLKNLGLMGAMLLIAAYGPGAISVDTSLRTEAFASSTAR